MKPGPDISIVVASSNARHSAAACVETMLSQIEADCFGGRPAEGRSSELVVVDNSTDGTYELLKERFPSLCILRQPPKLLIPQLWTAGIRHTNGDIVAITTAHCVPAGNWLESVRRGHQGPWAAVGGAIDNDRASTLLDWAVYFCRYSKFLPQSPAGLARDIAGDNASYKRSALDACQHAWSNGFWEPAIHAAIEQNGGALVLDPRVLVVHRRSFGAARFVRNRLLHGMQFGAERAQRLTLPKRVAYMLSTPLIGPLLCSRIVMKCLHRRARLAKLALSSPALVLFLGAWAVGELAGAVTARNKQ